MGESGIDEKTLGLRDMFQRERKEREKITKGGHLEDLETRDGLKEDCKKSG